MAQVPPIRQQQSGRSARNFIALGMTAKINRDYRESECAH